MAEDQEPDGSKISIREGTGPPLAHETSGAPVPHITAEAAVVNANQVVVVARGDAAVEAVPALPVDWLPTKERFRKFLEKLYQTSRGKLGTNHIDDALAHFGVPSDEASRRRFLEHLESLQLLGKRKRVVMAAAEHGSEQQGVGTGAPAPDGSGAADSGANPASAAVSQPPTSEQVVTPPPGSKDTASQVAVTESAPKPVETEPTGGSDPPPKRRKLRYVLGAAVLAGLCYVGYSYWPASSSDQSLESWKGEKSDYVDELVKLPQFQRVLSSEDTTDNWSFDSAKSLAGTLQSPYRGNWALNASSEFPTFIAWATEFRPDFRTDRKIEPQWVTGWLAFRDLVGLHEAGVTPDPDPFKGTKFLSVSEILTERGIQIQGDGEPRFAGNATLTETNWKESKAIFMQVLAAKEQQFFPRMTP